MNRTDQFLETINAINMDTVSESSYLKAKKCFLDYLGVTIAGAHTLQGKKDLKAVSPFIDKGSITIIGLSKYTSLQAAAFINGLNSHILELDDGHRFGMIHPGGPIFSALLPAAQQEKITGKKMLHGAIVGYEAAIRLASAIQPGHKQQGFHASGTCGTIGAAVAVATILDLSKQEMKDVISAAVTGAAGILAMIDDSSEMKPYNIGRAAMDGLTAAYTVAAGFSGPEDPLGGKRGFFSTLCNDRFNEKYLQKRNDTPLYIETIYQKPFAACRHCHAPIEAALNIRSTNQLNLARIERIEVKTYNLAVEGHDHTEIKGVNSAKMSIPFSVAVALHTGKAGIQEFSEDHITKTQIRDILKKTKVLKDEELSKLVPQKRSAIVKVILDDKTHYTCKVDYPKGEPENPLSAEELTDKFISLTTYCGKKKIEAEEIINLVSNIEDNLSNLLKRI